MYPPYSLPRIIKFMIVALIAAFIAQQMFPYQSILALGLTPALVIKRFWIWQLATYMVLHGSLIHLLFNALSLYWFGSSLAQEWGERRFLTYFLICGVGAGVLTVAVQFSSNIPTIGASGAIYGLLYAWARQNPNAVIYMYGLFPMRARHLVVLLFLLEFMLSQTPSPVARFAHLGGLAVGWLYFRLPDMDFWSSFAQWLRRPPEDKRREENVAEDDEEEEIDRILEKINARGIQSLTPWERRKLDDASRQKKS